MCVCVNILLICEKDFSLSDRNYTHNSNIREVKRIGGMDSVGVEIGHPGILNRVRGEISTALG